MVTSPTTDAIDWSAYAYSDETQALIETARAHFASLSGIVGLQAAFDGSGRPGRWAEIADGGYTAVGLPEEIDGIGSRIDLCALLETAGAAMLAEPLATHSAAAQVLRSAGLLEAISLESPMAIAEMRGLRAFAFDGAEASSAVLVTSEGSRTRVRVLAIEGATSTAGVDPSRPGVELDLQRATSAVDVELDAALDEVLAAARMCLAADLVGSAQRALDDALAHALVRRQFDRVVGSFQGIKHQLADAHVSVERARSLTLGAAVSLDADPLSPEAAVLAMLAKAAAADAATDAAALHVQLLGAMGLTFEAPSAWQVRRARHTAPVLGGAAALYAAAARRSLPAREGVA